jgi:hypothetical protein
MEGGSTEVFSMPLVIHPRLRRAISRIAAGTCVALFVSTGAAFASCTSHSSSTPFLHWGDHSSYFLVPGGSFEGPAAQVGWTLSEASIGDGDEPASVPGVGDDQSLTINPGGSATSPYFCLDATMPDFRFLDHQTAAGSDLKVVGLVKTRYGVAQVPVADLTDGSMPFWAAVAPIAIPSGKIPAGLSIPVAVRFEVPASSGSWQVDDVYIDPYRVG